MKKLLLILALASLYACSSNQEEEITLDTQTDLIQEEDEEVAENEVGISPGEFVEYHPNGNIKMKGRYNSDNQREGLWISYYDNNVKWSESYYVNGKLDGHSLTFFPNGQIRYRGEYDMDEKVGTWTFYSESGEITKEENY